MTVWLEIHRLFGPESVVVERRGTLDPAGPAIRVVTAFTKPTIAVLAASFQAAGCLRHAVPILDACVRFGEFRRRALRQCRASARVSQLPWILAGLRHGWEAAA